MELLRRLLNMKRHPNLRIFRKNINAKFELFMKTRCDLITEADNKLFKNRKQEPTFVLCSFQKLLN